MGLMPALGKWLGCKVPVGHVLGACFVLSLILSVNVGVGLTLMLEFLDEDKQTGGKEGEAGKQPILPPKETCWVAGPFHGTL